jgi:hypothetical protein
MARVEWSRHPDDIEPAVGMLICSQFPNAVRVTPSQGDGGVDIFVPVKDADKQREVYQVKSFHERLNSSRKRQITRSLKKVITTALEEGWEITKWHLVMPLDLTDNELRWFHDELTKDCGFPCEINGLLFCDTMAARYPKVIDYYMRDGRERLQAAMNNLTAVLSNRKSREENDALAPADVSGDLASIYRALNDCDPFYKYEFSASDNPPTPQPSADEPDLVAIHAMEHESVWIAVKIKARSLAALQECPVSGHLTIAIPKADGELHQQFEKFVDYGAPVAMPAGTVSGTLDFPGGLGGNIGHASLQVLAVPDANPSEPAELALAILAPDSDAVLARTVVKRIDLSTGQVGLRSVFADAAGLFTLEMLMAAGSVEGKMNLSVEYDLAGRRPAELVDGLEVLAHWHAPNRIAFGLPYGPPDFGVVATVPTEKDPESRRWATLARALTTLQDHVKVLLKMPEEMTKDQAIGIIEASKVVAGEPVTGTFSGTVVVIHKEPPQVDRDPEQVYEFAAIKMLKFELGDDVIEVGKQALFFLGRYSRTDDDESEIEPVSEGVSMRYTGDAEVTHVSARHFSGSAAVINTDEQSDGDPDAGESNPE